VEVDLSARNELVCCFMRESGVLMFHGEPSHLTTPISCHVFERHVDIGRTGRDLSDDGVGVLGLGLGLSDLGDDGVGVF